MAAVTGISTTGNPIIVLDTSLDICQDDENGERIIAEAKWYLPGFKNRLQLSFCMKIYLAVAFIIVAILTFLLAVPIILLIVYYRYCTKGPLLQTERLYLTQSSLVYRIVREQGGNFFTNIFCKRPIIATSGLVLKTSLT